MTKTRLSTLLAVVFLLVSAQALAADFKVGDAVDVKWKGDWYPASVIDAKPGQWKVHYDGYGSSWDEWVTQDRIRARAAAATGASWRVGDKVRVSWKGAFYPATILDAQGGQYLVHYDGYEASWDEWVGPDRVKAR